MGRARARRVLSWSADKYALFGEVSVNTGLDNFGDSTSVNGKAGLRIRGERLLGASQREPPQYTSTQYVSASDLSPDCYKVLIIAAKQA